MGEYEGTVIVMWVHCWDGRQNTHTHTHCRVQYFTTNYHAENKVIINKTYSSSRNSSGYCQLKLTQTTRTCISLSLILSLNTDYWLGRAVTELSWGPTKQHEHCITYLHDSLTPLHSIGQSTIEFCLSCISGRGIMYSDVGGRIKESRTDTYSV